MLLKSCLFLKQQQANITFTLKASRDSTNHEDFKSKLGKFTNDFITAVICTKVDDLFIYQTKKADIKH